MRDFNTSGRSSDAAQVFTPCPIHCQGYRRPIFPCGLATDTAPGLATDAQARRNISHYQFIVNTTGRLLSQLSERIWGPPVCAGTTTGGGAPKRRRAHPTIVGENPRPPISPSPQRRESTATHIAIPATPRIHGGEGPGGMGPRLHGDDDGHPHRHSRDSGNPWRGGAGGDGSPSPRGRRWASTSSFPRQREGGDGFPPARERRGAPISPSPQRRESTATHIVIPTTARIHGHHIVIPAKAGIHGGEGPGGMGPRLHGDDDGHPHRHSRDSGGPGDGFPSPRERRRGGSQVISE